MSQVVALLHGLADHLNQKNISIARKAIQALIEICSANYENQQMVYNAQLVETINVLLMIDIKQRVSQNVVTYVTT